VRIARVRVRALSLPLLRPLRTAYGDVAARTGWLVELEDPDGVRGFGEALPLPAFGGESDGACGDALDQAAAALAGRTVDAPGEASEVLSGTVDPATGGAPVARCALETALLDLVARRAGCSLAQQLGAAHPPAALAVNALLSAGSCAALAREAAGAVAEGYRTLKLKVAARPLAEDLEALAAVREAAPGARLRLDANGGWTEDDASSALRRIEEVAGEAIEWIEQPIPPGAPRALARLRRSSRLAIAADESVVSTDAASALLAAGAVDALVIKLPVLGGPLQARAVAERARDAGVRVAVTSFLDSSLGIAAAAQLAATLPQPGPACGLATARLLADDVAEAWPVEAGRLRLPAAAAPGVPAPVPAVGRGVPAPGLGIAPCEAHLARCGGAVRLDVAG
jgi:o-succinylbenzoate synthase